MVDLLRRAWWSLLIAERQVIGTRGIVDARLPCSDSLGAWCHRCGATLRTAPSCRVVLATPAHSCPRCAGVLLNRSATVRLGEHIDELREAILAIKHGGDRELARRIGRALGEQYSRCDHAGEAIVVPVPMPFARRIERKIDHACAIAHAFADATSLKVARILTQASGPPQALLSAHERRMRTDRIRLKRSRSTLPAGATVVLIDDVLTTGATIEQAARVLRQECGCRRVIAAVASVARTV